jgi:DNA-binding LacI/PurR family transcriptional regulator/signal transduction histidine kinase/CheY-like chemotaxis protein
VRKTIAVLIDYIDHLHGGYEGQLRSGFNSVCASHDLNLLIVTGRALGEEPYDRVYRNVRHGSVDGVVLVSAGLAARSGPEGLTEILRGLEGTPLVSLGMALPGVPSVVSDNTPGMRDSIEHLIVDHGRRRIAFIGGAGSNMDAIARHEVFREVLREHAVEYDPALVTSGPFTTGFGGQAMQKLLDLGVPIDAVVAANDGLALGALQVLRARGLRVPRDVALCGFDDLAIARHAHPPLTSVRQPLERMAETSVEHLLAQIAGRPVPMLTDLATESVRRVSCGCDSRVPRRGTRERLHSVESPLTFLDQNSARLIERLADAIQAPRPRAIACVCVLVHGLRAELGGDRGAFVAAFDDVAATAGGRSEIHDELQSVVTILRDQFGYNPELEDLWHAARRAIAAADGAEQARQRMAIEASYWRLLASGERLSTAFDWPSLKAALADELPDVVENAFISLYTDGDERELRPFFCLRDGKLFDPGIGRFPASKLLPPGVLEEHRRSTWFVLPLTCESDNLGIAVFDSGTGLGTHEMLRKQIGAALKSVALHREIVQKTMLHDRSVQERVATAKRMTSLSVLAGGVAHDLNNALGPLVALPDVILQELEEVKAGRDDSELRTDISTIKTASLRASQTIKDLLALGRQGRTSREALDLNLVVQSCVSTESKRADEMGVALELELSREALAIRASEAQVARAITNLIRNAVEAAARVGSVVVTTGSVRFEHPVAAYETIEPGEYAVVQVKDSGRGIDPADLGRIFEPFFSKKRASDSSGSGLGLSIVHGVVKEHDGFVDVESELAFGTEFTLYFPRSEEPAQRHDSRPAVVRGSACILVVDDDPVQLRTARRVLSRLGYDVVTTRSGVQAQSLCHGERARRFDLIIIDMLLNERDDGLAAFEQIERAVPGQRGIIASGHAPTERVRVAMKKGLAWLAKPYSSDELARAVHAALAAPAPSLAQSIPAPSFAQSAPPPAEELLSDGSLALARRPSERP